MTGRRSAWTLVLATLAMAAILSPSAWAADAHLQYRCRTLRAAVEDLIGTFGDAYPRGTEFLTRLERLEGEVAAGRLDGTAGRLRALQREALLSNPLLAFDRVLVVKRKSMLDSQAARRRKIRVKKTPGAPLGFPSNHECNSSLPREGYDNEIAVLSLREPEGELATLYRPRGDWYVGEMDLRWDADRLLFTQSDKTNWKLWEIGADGTGLRQVSRMPDDVDAFDACYLPDGRIVFGSTASIQAVPCWHGQKIVTNLYRMNADGTGVRQLCFDQDHDLHPVVLPDGQVLFHRWDYTGINHIFMRQLMVMNPDGTGQRAVYGSNSWFPNSLYFPRPLPGSNHRLISILSGYHGVHKMGQLVLIDTSEGWYEEAGLVRRISGRDQAIEPRVADILVDKDWPKFFHPYPLSEKYFLVACRPDPKANWGIYLADAFDNLVLIRQEPGWALLEPVPVRPRAKPALIADKVDLSRDDGVVYLHDIYSGDGLAGVPRGTVKSLRVIAYHFGYPGMAGPDKVGFGGPWEVMRILGTVPLEEDGSVMFRVPANTPVAVQALDGEGKAVQLMRSWFTVMPGETLSCVGCHEAPDEVAPSQAALALHRGTREIEPWRGPARGFDFAREVQPVLDRHCASCHDGRAGRPDLRAEGLVPDYEGKPLSRLGRQRLHQQMKREMGDRVKYTPAYDALIPYIRRPSIEDDVSMLVPGEYHADTSELIQILQKGHGGVQLDPEAWDRLVTWIDLNGPCHGTWGEVFPIPDGMHERRMELRRAYGGPTDDPERIPDLTPYRGPSESASHPERSAPSHAEAHTRVAPTDSFVDGRSRSRNVSGIHGQTSLSVAPVRGGSAMPRRQRIDLGHGVTLDLVRIPAGTFVMGDAEGEPDERPTRTVKIAEPFWMGTCEVTSEQFHLFDPDHDSRYYQKRHARSDDKGLPLDGREQPVVRVSWERANAFCRWLSERTGMRFSLPTEAQWEYACRAGTSTPLHYGGVDADFSAWANVGDLSFGDPSKGEYVGITGGLEHAVLEGSALSDRRFDDGFVVTAPVGRFRANDFGLYDMHGNAAEWTASVYETYGTDGTDRTNAGGDHRVVRGGSFFDRPERCRSAFRLAYPAWQRVFNVGFRLVAEMEEQPSLLAHADSQD